MEDGLARGGRGAVKVAFAEREIIRAVNGIS